jgi:sugar phosphate permease
MERTHQQECYNACVPDEQVQDNAEQDAAHTERGLRRRWVYLMPAVFITYSLAYLDRTNYGFGAAAGLAKTLDISDARAAFLGSAFFLGYFLFQIPGAAYAQRKSATRLVAAALVSWGVLAALTGVIREFWLLALDRLLLGVAESMILPAMLILLTHWFTRAERSRANAILILGNPVTVLWMSAVTGFLIEAVGWQMTFVLEGIPSVVWAFVWVLVVRDRPREARWMDEASCTQLTRELEMEQESLPRLANFRAALRAPGVVLLCVQYFCWSIGVYGFVLWLPTMIRAGSARGIETVGLLNAVPFLLAVILMLAVAHFSDRALRRERYVGPFLLLSGLALFISYMTAGENFWVAYAFLIVAGGAMYAPYAPFFSIVPEMLPDNVAGEVMALINSCGALGGFAGTWLVGLLQTLTGNSRAGYFLMSMSLMVAGAMIFRLKAASKTNRA